MGKSYKTGPISRTGTKIELQVQTPRPPPTTLSSTSTADVLHNVGLDDHAREGGLKQETAIFAVFLLIWEIGMMIIYGFWVDYEEIGADAEATAEFSLRYGFMRDVSIMIFFGFGFLMTFLRRYGFSAVGYCLLTCAFVVQWAILMSGFFFQRLTDGEFDDLHVGTEQIADALFCAGAVMITFGAVLGKVTPLQMVVLGLFETFFYYLNLWIGLEKYEAFDAGGGMFIHEFGAYFGMPVAIFLTSEATKSHRDNTSCYSSDLLSYAGTIWLWLLWPSFNAAIVPTGTPVLRAVVNTYLSLTGSTVAVFIFSRLFSSYKLEMVHIQNATLAGGVVMGVVAHLNITVGLAMALGFTSGLLSTAGFVFLTPFLNRTLRLQDVCGVHNLHGLPALLGALAAIFVALHANDNDTYDDEEEELLFPAGLDDQAGMQAAATFTTLGIAIGGGIVTGLILKVVGMINGLKHPSFFNDRPFWVLPSDYNQAGKFDEESLSP